MLSNTLDDKLVLCISNSFLVKICEQSIGTLGITINLENNLHTSKFNCFSENFPLARTFLKDFRLTSCVIEKIC